MRPPKGFEAEKFPLRHRLENAASLGLKDEDHNTVLWPIVRSAKGTIATNPLTNPDTIQVNPHNSNFEQDTGPLCAQMSIIDRLTISLKFTMLSSCEVAHLASGTAGPNFDDGVYTGDDVPVFNFLWRPVFNVFPEKLDAADDQTGTTVAAILGVTKDATLEDVVPVTTNKLSTNGPSEKNLAVSTVNGVEAFTDYNHTTNVAMEDHVFDEDLLHEALRRYTNKGALRSCFGATRNVTLTRKKPYMNFYVDKFVPRAIRRIQPYAFFGIQVHMPIGGHVSQQYLAEGSTTGTPHLGIKLLANYHEWNSEHDQDRGTPA